jgi:hypothetical protein
VTQRQPDAVRALIAAAGDRGILSAEQCDALGALQAELEGSEVAAVAAPRPRGLDFVTVAYAIGAMLVVFAFAWFLADRWVSLGPWGVLVVALVYAGLLVGCSIWLERRGFRQASAISLTLAVALAPVVSWSVQVISGLWLPDPRDGWLNISNPWQAVCWVVSDLVTLLAALLAFRWKPSVVLTIPMTIMLWGLGLHVYRAVAGDDIVPTLDKWLMLANGLLVCAIAGEIDRRQARERTRGRDFAFWFWLGGLFAFAVAYLSIWGRAGLWRHTLVAVAAILIVLSLLLRRRTHLAFGFLALFGYLSWLALDVLRAYLSLPAVLATLGIVLILGTVWVQRRFPKIVERVNAERGEAALPAMVTRAPLILVLGLALLSIPDVKAEMEQRAFRQHLDVLQRRSGSARARMAPSKSQAPRPPAR